jgi:hypothetical protein
MNTLLSKLSFTALLAERARGLFWAASLGAGAAREGGWALRTTKRSRLAMLRETVLELAWAVIM